MLKNRAQTFFMILTLVFFGALPVHAQYMQWGTGMAMGVQQNCGYQQRPAMGSQSESDEVSELLQAQKEEKEKLRDLQKKKKSLEKDLERLHTDIENSLDSRASEFAFNHMENGRRCEDYQQMPEEGGGARAHSQGSVDGESEGEGFEPPPGPGPDQNKLPVSGNLRRYCDSNKSGTVSTSICDDNRYRNSDGGGRASSSCKRALPEYRKKYADSQKVADDIEAAQRNLERYKDDIADVRKQAREDRQNGNTEGDVCLECMAQGRGYVTEQNSPNWASVAANVGTGLAAMYMGYKTNKMVAEYNSDLGWPTTANNSIASVGYPYLAAGIYGALGGGTGQGAFGCGSTNGVYGNMNGGAFGYPMSMYNSPMGGGMYSSMNPMMSMYGNGMYGNGMMNSMNPYGLGGSFGLSGSLGVGNMYGNMGMGNYGLGSMYGNMGLGNYGLGNMYGNGLDTSTMQMYLQQQQSQMQNYMARYQTMTSLQSELSNLMYRIQQVQYGNYGNYSSSSYPYYNGYSTGTGYLSTGTSTYVPGAIPAPSTTGTATTYPTSTIYGR